MIVPILKVSAKAPAIDCGSWTTTSIPSSSIAWLPLAQVCEEKTRSGLSEASCSRLGPFGCESGSSVTPFSFGEKRSAPPSVCPIRDRGDAEFGEGVGRERGEGDDALRRRRLAGGRQRQRDQDEGGDQQWGDLLPHSGNKATRHAGTRVSITS